MIKLETTPLEWNRATYEREVTKRIKAMARIISTAPHPSHREWAFEELKRLSQHHEDIGVKS